MTIDSFPIQTRTINLQTILDAEAGAVAARGEAEAFAASAPGNPKDPVACATTANITLSGEQTIDGVLTSTSRVLVKNQSTASQNGLYVSAAGAWSRATDMDASAEVDFANVYVSGGTTQGGTRWVTTANSITLGTDAMPWVQIADDAGLEPRVGALEGDIEVTPAASKVPRAEGSARPYIVSTWFAPQDSLPDDAQTLISPEAAIPVGWRDTGDTVGTRKVIARDLWLDVVARMSLGRVDFVGIGDSNQIFQGHGWDHGFQKALVDAGFQMWATGLISQNENNGNGAGQGYLYNRFGALIGATSGAPADLDKFLNKGSGSIFPAFYTFVADAATVGSSTNLGLILQANCPIDNGAALTFDIHWGSFNSGSGSFRPYVRLEQSPFTGLSFGSLTSTNTGAFGMHRASRTITANAGRSAQAVSVRPLVTGTTPITGPFFMTYYRARNTGRTVGFSYGTLEARGGQSLRTMAADIQQASDETLTHYFGILREDQDQDEKCIVICINSGLNDRNETLASVGPGTVTDADSAEAMVDNFKAIRIRLEEIWTLNSWPLRELYFLFFVSHPIDDPDDAELVAYRTAMSDHFAVEVPRGEYVDLSALTNEAEMLAAGDYASSGADRSHLTQSGYERLSALIIGAARLT